MFPTTFKTLPKWQNFAKSGHAAGPFRVQKALNIWERSIKKGAKFRSPDLRNELSPTILQ